ncbi:hypothetical protein ACJX0J_024680 [Zea mays]
MHAEEQSHASKQWPIFVLLNALKSNNNKCCKMIVVQSRAINKIYLKILACLQTLGDTCIAFRINIFDVALIDGIHISVHLKTWGMSTFSARLAILSLLEIKNFPICFRVIEFFFI